MLQKFCELQTAFDIAWDDLLSFKGGLYPVMLKDDISCHLHTYFRFQKHVKL